MVIITMICWFYFPLEQNSAVSGSFKCLNPENNQLPDFECIFFQSSGLIKGFYACALLYVVLSALQIRFGEPINKGKRVLLTAPTKPYYFTNKITRAIPFFFTAATCLDFMLTPTSLEFFEWVKFESIYNTLFEDIYKMRARDSRIPGLKMGMVTKMMFGIGGTFIQIFVILLPLILFRNYNSESNTIYNA
jgi:hypothetical protein